MRRIILLSVIILQASLCAVHAQEKLPQWKPGYLDIHAIATGSGENTFIIMPDGTTMLVDMGQMGDTTRYLPHPGKTPAQWVARYIRTFSEGLPHPRRLDYFFLTHFHSDHMGMGYMAYPGTHGYRLNGITELGEYLSFNEIVDRGYPRYDYPSERYFTRHPDNFMNDYRAFLQYKSETDSCHVSLFCIGSHKQFSLKNDPRAYRKLFDVFCVAGNGYITTGRGLGARKMTEDNPEFFDENMFSCSIRIKYGAFSYYLGGDTPGSNYWVKQYLGGAIVTPERAANELAPNRDFESQIADVIAPVTAMKLDHHGCPDVCNPYFLYKMRPQVIVVNGSATKQPSPPTLLRIADPQMPCAHKVFVTMDKSRETCGDEIWEKCVHPAMGHIVIRVYEDGKSYRVYVLDAHSEDYPVIYEGGLMEL